MRRLIWGAVFIVVIGCVWWGAGTFAVQRGVHVWLQERGEHAWQIDAQDVQSGGFPASFHTALLGVSVADPQKRGIWRAGRIDVSAPVYWPGFVTIDFPSENLSFETPLAQFDVFADNASAQIRVRPGMSLDLEKLALVSDAWRLEAGGDWLVGAQDLIVSMTQNVDIKSQYFFDIDAKGMGVGGGLRDRVGIPQDWPAQFDVFNAKMSAVFDRPWGIGALGDVKPQPRKISLSRAEVKWGELGLSVSGDFDIDGQGVPTGKLSLRAQNWRQILELAVRMGGLPRARYQETSDVLELLASLSGDPDDIDLQLNFAGGMVAVGFIPIGPAPRLVIR